MKNLILILLCILNIAAFGQDAKYMQAMEKNVAILDSATVPATLQNANNAFERIGNANQKEWLPLYYQSYCHVMLGMKQEENGKKDEYYDRAQVLVDKADSINPNNSENYVLKALINSMKISVDPMTRGQKLGMQSAMLNSKALELDKENPRAYLLKGTGLMFTPPQYGGGKDKALPILEEAVAKFKTFKPSSTIMPRWGEARAITVLEQCKNEQ
jgi:hypothetical protein